MGGWQDQASDWVLDVALSPALWLSAFLAIAASLLFYLWRGGGRRQLGRDVLAGLAGFAAGQVLGMALRLPDLRLGDVQLIWGLLGCVAGLVAGRRFPRGRQTTSKAHSVPRVAPPRKGRKG
jgi:hypothetical protein